MESPHTENQHMTPRLGITGLQDDRAVIFTVTIRHDVTFVSINNAKTFSLYFYRASLGMQTCRKVGYEFENKSNGLVMNLYYL